MVLLDEKMTHCYQCGHELQLKFLENEGEIPYCPECRQYRFPMFNTACSMIVVDEKAKEILLIQQYGKPFYILVAGYIMRGENAESTVIREVKEETGMDVDHIRFNRSKFFQPSNTLMVNFTAFVKDAAALHVNEEVDSYRWFTFKEARENIKHGSLAEEFLVGYLDEIGE
ncbi:MAG: NUDIX domain-containing protein [Dorea sp.]|nr:NUDIX domain-containing protein [Dorea sp.]